MALINFQKALVDIYTDKSTRTDFLSDKEVFYKKYNLDDREKKAISALPKTPLKLFAESLINKKNKMIKKILAKNPNIVAASSAYINGPMLFFKNQDEIKKVEIGTGAFNILKTLPDKGFMLSDLFKSYLAAQNAGISDFLNISLLINKETLWEKNLKIL